MRVVKGRGVVLSGNLSLEKQSDEGHRKKAKLGRGGSILTRGGKGSFHSTTAWMNDERYKKGWSKKSRSSKCPTKKLGWEKR